jgi:hypothetical protein
MNVAVNGLVTRKTVGAGSKSERDAVMLEANGRVYLLRRKGATPSVTIRWSHLSGSESGGAALCMDRASSLSIGQRSADTGDCAPCPMRGQWAAAAPFGAGGITRARLILSSFAAMMRRVHSPGSQHPGPAQFGASARMRL